MKSDKEKYILYDSIYIKCKYSDREQISGCLLMIQRYGELLWIAMLT